MECLVGSVEVAESVGVDDGTGGVVDADGEFVGDGGGVATDVEGVGVEAVPGDGGVGGGLAFGAGEGDVDLGGDVVGEVVVGECGGEAQGCVGGADGDFDEVGVAFEPGLGVDAAGDAFDSAVVSHLVEGAVGDPLGECLGMGEDLGKRVESDSGHE